MTIVTQFSGEAGTVRGVRSTRDMARGEIAEWTTAMEAIARKNGQTVTVTVQEG